MKKFMIGCGAVVGLILLLGLVSSWILVRSLKSQLPMDELKKQQKELVQSYGSIDDYVPPLGGRFQPQRMECYLRVRENLPHDDTAFANAMDEVSRAEKSLDEAQGLEKLKIGLKMAKRGMGVARVATSYLATRDSLLIAEKMGPGEYLFITTTAAVCDLQWDPPYCRKTVERDSTQKEKLSEANAELRRALRRQLENARRELQAKDTRSTGEDQWLTELTDALDHGPIDHAYLPFQDGLPQSLQDSLQPYRERIEATLPNCAEAWLMELMVLTDRENHKFQIQLGEDDRD